MDRAVAARVLPQARETAWAGHRDPVAPGLNIQFTGWLRPWPNRGHGGHARQSDAGCKWHAADIGAWTGTGSRRPILATQPAECRSRKRSVVVRSRATVGITSTAAR